MMNVEILAALGDVASIEAEVEKMEPMDESDFETGEETEFLAFGPIGHGLMSWAFRLRLKTTALDFDFTLPCLRALADEESRKTDAEDLRTVCKLVVAALRLAEGDRTSEWRLAARAEPEAGCTWRLEDAHGERSGNGWTSLVDLLVGFSDGLSDSSETRIYG